MSETLFTYCPESVNLLIFGFPAEGFVDGTFITLTKDMQPFTSARTADGNLARLYNNDKTYTLQLTLHSGADFNNTLTKFWLVDELTHKGKFPILLKDGSGSDLFFSTTSWIEGLPSMTKSSGVDSRTWTFRCSGSNVNFGGNESTTSALGDLANLALGALGGFL